MPSGSAPLMLQGAIAPGYCMNPNFSIVKYDGWTKAPSDMSKYFGDVKEAFETDSSGEQLTWNEEVKSVVDLFGMERFTNDEVLSFAPWTTSLCGILTGIHTQKAEPKRLIALTSVCTKKCVLLRAEIGERNGTVA